MSIEILKLARNLRQIGGAFQKHLQFRAGFSLVEAMIALSILSVVIWGLIGVFSSMSRDQRRLSTLFQLQQIQKNISTLVSSDGAWKEIVKNNQSLACLRSPASTSCLNGTVDLQSIFTAGGAEFFNSATQGFGTNGEVCFLTSPQCKIRLKFSVELTCPGTPAAANCATPDQIVFRGVFSPFQDEPGKDFVFNPANYTINVRKDAALAAGAGGQVLEFSCGFKSNDSYSFDVVNSKCERQTAGAPTPACDLQACPQGYGQIGEVSTKITSGGWGSSAGNGNLWVFGYCSRFCGKL